MGAMHMQVQPDIQLYWYISVFPMYTKNIASVWGLDLGALGWINFHIQLDIVRGLIINPILWYA